MAERGRGILPPIKFGDSVLVNVPEFDRSRGDPGNITAVLMEAHNNKFVIGTKYGKMNKCGATYSVRPSD